MQKWGMRAALFPLIHVDLRAQKVQSLFNGMCEQTFLSPRSLNCLVFATSARARHYALSS